jgi:hypothetical protein
MDFSAIFQLRAKKFWWMDVIFYFVISLLIATVLCWVIFLVKDGMIKEQINNISSALQTVGTDQQKEYEKEVISYQKKINDFSTLFQDHEFASNVFAFVQAQTMQNVWFKQFNLDEKNNGVQLSGESDSIDAFSRQVATFEKNKYVKSIGTLNSSLGAAAKTEFNINLVLDQSIFSYLSSISLTPAAAATSEQLPAPQSATTTTTSAAPATSTAPGVSTTSTPQTTSAGQTTLANNPLGLAGTATTPSANGQQTAQAKSSEKLIISFNFPLNPEVVGAVDGINYTVTLNVPYGTDVKNLTPSIAVSPDATILPASNVSQDFTSPVIYRVTAQDGLVQNYQVKVIIAAPPSAAEKSSQSGSAALIIVIFLVVIIVIMIVVIFLFFGKKNKETK